MLIAIVVLLLLVIALQLLALQNTAWVLYLVKMKAPEKPVPETPVVEPEPKTEWVAEEPVTAPVVAGKQESTRRGKKETTT
jgi:hypothetical protein